MIKLRAYGVGAVTLTAILLVYTSTVFAGKGALVQALKQPAESIAPFPPANAGYKRQVIYLPALSDESLQRVELQIGHTLVSDCNTRGFGGEIKQQTLAGWGYPFYVVASVGMPFSTMMACPESAYTEAFVPMHHQLGLLAYNSRVPIVIYAPEALQVKYRIWQAQPDVLDAIER